CFRKILYAHQSLDTTEQCPERILGNERRQTCPKKCQQDKDCGNKRQCLCDGQCGLSCVAPGRMCPWPLPPGKNFDVALLSPSPSFSALLEVRCKPGFAMHNGLDSTIRRCQGDRQWSGDEPVCTGVVCPPPKEVERGHLVAVQRTEYEVGDTIYYLCKKNVLLDGPNQVTCLPNGTWSAEPVWNVLVSTSFSSPFLPLSFRSARCPVPAQRSRVIVGGVKRWPYDLTDGVVAHGENVTFFCKHPEKLCSFTATEVCVDGALKQPSCYLDPTWLQFKLFPHRLVSEIDPCDPADLQ
uniref:Beta-2-glycoprotein 1 n=1 Tax=Sinocyclocheilus rhinocerous TaxID=307959 RepID=A0A673M848_9TELE